MDSTQANLMENAKPFFIVLHGQPPGHLWRLPASNSSSRRRKVPKSKHCLQHQPASPYTCCGSICCRKRQTSKPYLTSQSISLSLFRRSEIASQLLLLLRLNYVHCTCEMCFTVSVEYRARNAVCGCDM